MPDVPVSGSGESLSRPYVQPAEGEPSTVNEAKQKMASEMERGGTPYDFSAEIEPARQSFSTANVAAGVAFVGLVAIVLFAGFLLSDLWRKLDEISATVSELSERVNVRNDGNSEFKAALIRAELHKTIATLKEAQVSGDPEVAAKAKALAAEAAKLLQGYMPVSGEPIVEMEFSVSPPTRKTTGAKVSPDTLPAKELSGE